MNCVSKLIEELKKRKISFHYFETEMCKFSNGYLKNLKDGKIRYEKLVIICDKLGIDVMEFSDCDGFFEMYPFLKENLKEDERKKEEQFEIYECLEELKENSSMRVLLHSAKGASKEQIEAVAEMLMRIKGDH